MTPDAGPAGPLDSALPAGAPPLGAAHDHEATPVPHDDVVEGEIEPVPSPDDDVATSQTVRLSAPPGFRLLDLGAIADDVVTTSGPSRQMLTVYFDAPDLRLVRWGAVLRHRAGDGWTVRLPRSGGEKRRREWHFDGEAGLPPEEALALLKAYVRTARLRPVARLRTVRRVVVLRTHEGRKLAEIDDDEVSVLDGRRVAGRFREVDVDVAAGAPSQLLDGILQRLHSAGCGVVDPTPKLVQALGARALEPPEVVLVDLHKNSRAGDAVRRAISSAVLRLLQHDAGLRTALEPEDVHQARVATRRLRSDLRTFAPLVERTFAEPIREELRWLAEELGLVRDAEVLAMRLRLRAGELGSGDLEAGLRIVSHVDDGVDGARAELSEVLRGERYLALLDGLVAAAQDPELTELGEHAAAEVCPELVAIPWRRIRKAVGRLGDAPPDEALHEVRIHAKRCRYAAEAVAPVLGRRALAFARSAAALQEVLGDFHDAIVAAEWLRSHGERGVDAFVAGRLYARELALAQQGREAWPAAWKQLRREWASWM